MNAVQHTLSRVLDYRIPVAQQWDGRFREAAGDVGIRA